MRLDRIAQALKTVYNVQDGLPPDASMRLYVRLVQESPAFAGFKEEVEHALIQPTVSWKALLFNAEYEVYAAETEEEARQLARQLLLDPLKGEP
jgi:hypothetical protein